jgi:hypothetical protein
LASGNPDRAVDSGRLGLVIVFNFKPQLLPVLGGMALMAAVIVLGYRAVLRRPNGQLALELRVEGSSR